MAIEKRNHLYEVLIRGTHEGISGVHQKYCECLVDSETGEVLKESITKAAKVELSEVDGFINSFCRSHIEQVANQLATIADLQKQVSELSTKLSEAEKALERGVAAVEQLKEDHKALNEKRKQEELKERRQLQSQLESAQKQNAELAKAVQDAEVKIVTLQTMAGRN